MSKVWYKVGFHESNDESKHPEFLEFSRQVEVAFPPPIGTEVCLQLEDSEVDPEHDHCEFFVVTEYEQKLRGRGDEPFESGEIVAVLSPRPKPDDEPSSYFGKVEHPEGFSKLLEHFGWTPTY